MHDHEINDRQVQVRRTIGTCSCGSRTDDHERRSTDRLGGNARASASETDGSDVSGCGEVSFKKSHRRTTTIGRCRSDGHRRMTTK